MERVGHWAMVTLHSDRSALRDLMNGWCNTSGIAIDATLLDLIAAHVHGQYPVRRTVR